MPRDEGLVFVVTRWRSTVTYEDDLEEHLLVDLHELLVPLLDVGGLLASIGFIVLGLVGIVAVVLAPFDDLSKDSLVNLTWQLAVGRVVGKGGVLHWEWGWECPARCSRHRHPPACS